jgi:ABC-2 type transport system ATP-binding protein
MAHRARLGPERFRRERLAFFAHPPGCDTLNKENALPSPLVIPLIVEIEKLTKIYAAKQRVVAVDGIDLELHEGEIFGLLGPNGAGKTTTISIATTRALPTSGTVRIDGVDVVRHPAHARQLIGVVPQFNTLDRSLTVYENLYFHCRYFGFSHGRAKARSLELLTQFMLSERKAAYPSELSGGLAQRVQIARAIAHRPRVLFLDEPSAGLDPQSRMAMWSAVQQLRSEGITVLLTTHYMEEADQLSDRLAIIDHGRVLALGSPEKLKETFGALIVFDLKLKSLEGVDALIASLKSRPDVTNAEATADGLRVLAASSDGLLPDLVQAAAAYGLRDLKITEPSVETVFIQLTGRDLRE